MSFPYFSTKGDWDSTLTLNNASVTELPATVTLYSLEGQPLRLPSFNVKPNSNIAVSLRDLIRRNPSGGQFQEGSVDVRFNSNDSMAIAPQLKVSDSNHGLSFDMEPPMMLMSSRLEGLWWSVDKKTTGQVMLCNTTDADLNVSINVEWRGNVIPAPPLSLSSHQTAVVEIEKLLKDLQIEGEGIERGGLSISHNGAPGALIAHGVIQNKEARFASNLPFIDPSAQKNSVLNGTGLMLAHPALGTAFPETSFFMPQLALKNASPTPQSATITVRCTEDGALRNRVLPPVNLAPHEVRMADFSSLMAEIRNLSVSAGRIKIQSAGAPGSLVAALSSVDAAQNIEVDVPLVSRSERSGEGGNHPFRLGERFRSVAYLTNITQKPTKVAVIIFHEGGMYTPELISVPASATIAIDPMQLRDNQVKDIQGRTLPRDLTQGQFFWHPHQGEALIGRVVTLDRESNTASNFSCPNCCQQEPSGLDIIPTPISGLVGDFCQLTVNEWESYCGQYTVGPYNYTYSVNYSCDNTSVATVNSTGGLSCVGLGNATLTVSFDYWHSDYTSGESCGMFPATASGTTPVTVFRLRIRTAGTSIHFEDSDSGASIVAGEAFAIIAEAINAVGDILPINVAVSTSTSRTLDSSEIGLPTSFNIVNGSYNSGGLLLNRVSGTQSGTSYRFSTAAGGFKDFALYTYFRVTGTKEGLVGGTTACGHVIQSNDHFVSLPSTGLCDIGVVVHNGVLTGTTTIREVGPWFPHSSSSTGNPCVGPNDPYWNTGGVPRVLSDSCDTNNSAIDLADGTAADIGITGIGTVVWRFL